LAGLAARAQSGPTQQDGSKILPYRLTLGDWISVQIFDEKLNVKERVDAKGEVHCALIGSVYVYGDTLEQAEKTIAQAYIDQRILRHPQVTVTVETYAEREVSVQGQVKEPRRYPLPPESAVTLADVIEKAGGFTDVARGTDVKVTRILPDGTTKVWDHVDVEDFLKGKLKDKEKLEQTQLVLEPGDVIYVPERII